MKRLLVIALLAAGAALSQTAPKVDIARLDYGLAARALAPGVWVVEGANADFSPANGCNIINTGFIATGAGVIVVNTGPSKRYGEQLRALIERTVREPVVQVIHLNLHPDYFLGNQAFADVPRLATDSTRAGMAREAKAYEDNLYRLCGDWMKGTQAVLPSGTAMLGPLRVGGREMELREYRGHTDSDLVLVDKASGVVFAGGLVFAQRIPTTPHAQVGAWLGSLQSFSALPLKTLVPSHGPVRSDASAVGQTQRYLQWLDRRFTQAAEQGVEMNELLRAEVPAEFLGWAAFGTEYTRNVAHLYPRYEQAVLGGGKAKP
ncbi:MAG TPA: quinoprotein relay system zinc metallohydrolase 1 [Piscinibacter sp.]|nr:quinoprotein relay system zinc metallohydrolase 1 [Piscinibacter sp.]HPG79967.1 quinoprotein relay system zinc metallohydrolase 1 [Piscinibacter sp.]HPM65202.1 quinoprotein relay system zinc metallohydrolase 1 [Piscinibacter sp.]